MSHPAPYPPFSLPQRQLRLEFSAEVPSDAAAVGHVVFVGDEPPASVGVNAARAAELGFTAQAGSTIVLAGAEGPVQVLVGGGKREDADLALVRDAASLFARAIPRVEDLILVLPSTGLSTEDVASAAAEGAALARYVYRIGEDGPEAKISSLTLVSDAAQKDAVEAGLARGEILIRATKLARDLAGTPGGILTATRMGEVAKELGAASGLEVEVFDEQALVELGCGGLLGINLGSVEPPAMIKLVYRPEGEPTGRLTFVGKGIMYDAGGLALKPGDEMHAVMKNDMTGAGAAFAAMTALRDLGCTTQVTGYLMCTDNMPSGSAYKLGDVLTCRNGKTVEIKNTDAEGRIAMMDGLALAVEAGVDAIVDIATLTGAALMALGKSRAAVLGNDQATVDRVVAAAKATDEPVWQLPLERKYRKQLDSDIADISNLGGPHAGATTAALFLDEFVAKTPWAHIDIAGTMSADADDAWRSAGATGFGARLLAHLAAGFDAGAA